MMSKVGQAMRDKFLNKLQSFVVKKDRREKGLSSLSGSASPASPDDDEELSTIEIDTGSPDRIIVNKQASQEDIVNMVDTNFFKSRKQSMEKPPVKIKEVVAARKASAAIEDKIGDFIFSSGLKSDEEKTQATKKSFYSTNPISGNVRPASQYRSTAFLRRR